MVKFKRPNQIFFLHFYLCVLIWSAATAKKESKKAEKERAERKKLFSIFGFQKPSAENLRFPEIERSDRCDIWSSGSQHLGQRFERLDHGFEVWRSGFRGVLHSRIFWVIFPLIVLF